MLIILEGPDGAGKTTFAERLAVQLPIRDPGCTVTLMHRGPPTGHPLDEYVAPLLDYRPASGHHIICDRWHLGEWVYPRLLERATKMSPAVFSYVELFLRSRGALTVVMNPPVDVLQARITARGDAVVSPELVARIRPAFAITELPPHSAVHYSTPPLLDAVLAQAYGAEARATTFIPWVTPVGVATPRLLIAGDVRACGGLGCNHAVAHSPSGPAFMPYSGTSGQYLMRALPYVFESKVTLANACDVDDFRTMWYVLGCPPVISLGVNAHERLAVEGISHAAVPHPQYIRRFHHGAVRLYGRLLAGVAGTERNELKWRPSSQESTDEPSTREFLSTY